jgi:hypothetical protein
MAADGLLSGIIDQMVEPVMNTIHIDARTKAMIQLRRTIQGVRYFSNRQSKMSRKEWDS